MAAAPVVSTFPGASANPGWWLVNGAMRKRILVSLLMLLINV
jgi:hypothetical protein